MPEVAREKTPLTETQVAEVLRGAFLALFGVVPTAEVMGVGWAQIALENAHGQAIYQNNFGNITTGSTSGEYYTLETDEQVSPGVWKKLTLKYPAHPTPEDGAMAYWRLITTKYHEAFQHFELGDAPNAARALHRSGYFTANPEPIAATFGRLYAHYQAQIGPALSPPLLECPRDRDTDPEGAA